MYTEIGNIKHPNSFQITITENLRSQVITRLETVEPDTLMGFALQSFSKNANLKSEEDFWDLLESLYTQFHEDPFVIKKILGINFLFFQELLS